MKAIGYRRCRTAHRIRIFADLDTCIHRLRLRLPLDGAKLHLPGILRPVEAGRRKKGAYVLYEDTQGKVCQEL